MKENRDINRKHTKNSGEKERERTWKSSLSASSSSSLKRSSGSISISIEDQLRFIHCTEILGEREREGGEDCRVEF